MKRVTQAVMFVTIALAVMAPATVGFCAEPENPLASFEPLIGPEWELDGSIQTFEWGVGKLSVVSKSWYEEDGKRTLLSEGIWFWHPGEGRIRGYFTAIGMPVNFFEYATRFEGNTVVSDLVTWSPEGQREEHRETMALSEDAYVWTLYAKTEEGEKRSMGGTFVRRAVQ